MQSQLMGVVCIGSLYGHNKNRRVIGYWQNSALFNETVQ